ncbi:hypothetical protein EJB05_13949, partial [Eragrostis curvula]
VSLVARQMVERFVFSKKIGQIASGGGGGNPFLGQQMSSQKDYSMATTDIVDAEVIGSLLDHGVHVARPAMRTGHAAGGGVDEENGAAAAREQSTALRRGEDAHRPERDRGAEQAQEGTGGQGRWGGAPPSSCAPPSSSSCTGAGSKGKARAGGAGAAGRRRALRSAAATSCAPPPRDPARARARRGRRGPAEERLGGAGAVRRTGGWAGRHRARVLRRRKLLCGRRLGGAGAGAMECAEEPEIAAEAERSG